MSIFLTPTFDLNKHYFIYFWNHCAIPSLILTWACCRIYVCIYIYCKYKASKYSFCTSTLVRLWVALRVCMRYFTGRGRQASRLYDWATSPLYLANISSSHRDTRASFQVNLDHSCTILHYTRSSGLTYYRRNAVLRYT